MNIKYIDMKEILKLTGKVLALVLATVLLYSCGDDNKDEPEQDPKPDDQEQEGGKFYSVYYETDPEISYVGSEGGQVTAKILWTDKKVNPSTLSDEDREKYYSLDILYCSVYNGDNVVSDHFVSHSSPAEYVIFNDLEGVKAKKEIRDDGYLYVVVDIPSNPQKDSIRYIIHIEKVLYTSFPFYMGCSNFKIEQKGK